MLSPKKNNKKKKKTTKKPQKQKKKHTQTTHFTVKNCTSQSQTHIINEQADTVAKFLKGSLACSQHVELAVD